MPQPAHLLPLLAIFAAASTVSLAAPKALTAIPNCQIQATSWGDGDSFQVIPPTGEPFTIRLYGADALECKGTDESDARRLRDQRRYFGIAQCGKTTGESIQIAKGFGEQATKEAFRFASAGVTIHTTFADARGDGRFKRFYGFVSNPEGRDLAEHLVSVGLARAFGVNRTTPDGRSHKEYGSHLDDLELRAAAARRGIWSLTDWDALPEERRDYRQEQEEIDETLGRVAIAPGEQVDINAAPRDKLMRLPSVGEITANRIIEHRPYLKAEDLLEVPGIGQGTLKKLLPFVVLTP